MLPGSKSSFRLFTLAGITVYLHWSWFLIAIIQVQLRAGSSPLLGIIEYVGLFAMVLMHEFGHALACRQVGGEAREILLWPLGGVAYVNPPRRPGAVLWSIAAGPLVNLLLVPVFYALIFLLEAQGLAADHYNLYVLLKRLELINVILLVFNLLPIYPLDGGQIVQALLWFKLGQAKSLAVASAMGLVISCGFLIWALSIGGIWYGLLAAFALHRSWIGFQQARALQRIENWPRHDGYRCPSCNTAPPVADIWRCGRCNGAFDLFAHHGHCPACGEEARAATCPECGQSHPLSYWKGDGPVIDV